MKEKDFIVFFIGVLTCQLLVRILKPFIGQLRPLPTIWKGKFGMPSGRATLMMFIATYFSLRTKNQLTKVILYSIALASISIKYITGEHSLPQLIAGGLLGAIVAYFFEKLS